MTVPAKIVVAGSREEGTICRHCHREIVAGDQTVACLNCGGIHHWECWTSGAGCGDYECSRGNRSLAAPPGETIDNSVLQVTEDDLSRAIPLELNRAITGRVAQQTAGDLGSSTKKRWNRTAIASLVLAIAGIPLFGLVTGLIAVAIGCLALSRHSRQLKGAAIAVAGILLGIVDVVGWTAGLMVFYDVPEFHVAATEQFDDPDFKGLQELPPTIRRAMKSNVLIQMSAGLGFGRSSSIGSGVILRIANGTAWIVTNRHVVDSHFSPNHDRNSNELPKGTRLSVKSIGQPMTTGQLVWIAPHGIDLALVTIPISSREAKSAKWDSSPKIIVGDDVFAIGNPHGLGWTYTPGGISQLRLQTKGPLTVRVIQTSAAINPGNSGGGLYDREGHLVGINTWTQDKRFAEGLSFSIAFHTLLPILPAGYGLSENQMEEKDP